MSCHFVTVPSHHQNPEVFMLSLSLSSCHCHHQNPEVSCWSCHCHHVMSFSSSALVIIRILKFSCWSCHCHHVMSPLSSALVILIVMIIRVVIVSVSCQNLNQRSGTILGAIGLVYLHFRPSLLDAFITQRHLHHSTWGQKTKTPPTTITEAYIITIQKPKTNKHQETSLPPQWSSNLPKNDITNNGMIHIIFTTMIQPTQEQSSDEVEHSGRQQRCPWLPSSSCSPPWSTPEFLFSVILKAIFVILRLPRRITVCWKSLLSQK